MTTCNPTLCGAMPAEQEPDFDLMLVLFCQLIDMMTGAPRERANPIITGIRQTIDLTHTWMQANGCERTEPDGVTLETAEGTIGL